MSYAKEAYEQITGFTPNPKPFVDRSDQERREGFAALLTSLDSLPDDDVVRDFMVKRPMNIIPQPGSTLFQDGNETHAA